MSRTQDLLKKKQSGGLEAPRSAAVQNETTTKGQAVPQVQTTPQVQTAGGSRTKQLLEKKGIAAPTAASQTTDAWSWRKITPDMVAPTTAGKAPATKTGDPPATGAATTPGSAVKKRDDNAIRQRYAERELQEKWKAAQEAEDALLTGGLTEGAIQRSIDTKTALLKKLEAQRERANNTLQTKSAQIKASTEPMPTEPKSESDRKNHGTNPERDAVGELDRAIAALQARIDQEQVVKTYAGYEALRSKPDFKEKSSYKTTANGRETQMNYFTGEYTETGYDDILYDILNGDETAASRGLLYPVRTYTGIPDGAVDIFNYLYATKGKDAAYQYMDFVAEKAYTGAEAIGLSAYKASGLWSITETLGAIGGGETPELDAIRDDIETAQRQHPKAAAGGNVAGTMGLMLSIASGIGAIPGFASMAPVAQAVVSGAGTMGGTAAIQGLGDAATGVQSWEDYVADVLTNSAAGAAGGGASYGIGIAGTNFLKAHGLTQNMFARTVVSGLSGAGYSVGKNAVTEGAAFLRDPENYEMDEGRLVEDALVGFAFSSLGYLTRNYTTDPTTAAQMDADDALVDKYFKNMTQEEAKKVYRNLARENHPDRFYGTPQAAQAEEVMKEINRAWELFQIRQGATAYQAAQTARASGDAGAYERAAEDFADSVNGLQVVVTEGGVPTTEVAEAMQILNAISSDMSKGLTANENAAITAVGKGDGLVAGEAPARLALPLPEQRAETERTSVDDAGGALRLPELPTTEQEKGTSAQKAEVPTGASETTRSHLLGANGSDAPVESSITDVERDVKAIFESAIKSGKGRGDYAAVARSVAEKFRGEEAEAAGAALERMVALDGPYGIDAAGKVYPRDPETHMDRRDIWSVSPKGLKAFQFENPELHPYFVEAAQLMLTDLDDTQPGERLFLRDEDGYISGVTGLKRRTTPEIETLKDDFRYSYDDIRKALEAIVNDEGQENYAAAKRVEVLLDEMLTYGHKSLIGYEYEPNTAYIEAKKRIAGADLSEREGSDGHALDEIDADLQMQGSEENLSGGIENVQNEPAGAQAAPTAQPAGTGEVPTPANGGRLYGTDTGEQGGGLEKRTAGGQKRGLQANAARGRVAAVGTRDVGAISARQAGLENGSDIQSMKVVPDDIVEQDEELRAIRADNSAAGYNTVFYIGKAFLAEGGEGAAIEGWYSPERDEIWIKTDSLSDEATATKINKHERAHPELEQPGVMARVAERLLKEHSREELLDILRVYLEKYHGVYDADGGEVDEITGLSAGEMEILKEVAADAMAERNRFGVKASKLHDTVANALNEGTVKPGKEVEAATARRTGPPEGGVRYSYGGRNANHADSESLARAEAMERKGDDKELIRQETGWFRGMDGLWRFEIDDSGMEYMRSGTARYRSDPAYQEYLELWDRFYVKGEQIIEADLDRLRELDGAYGLVAHAMSKKIAQGGAALGDILVHDELFQNYPQLRNTAVRFANLPDGTLGQYSSEENTITISDKLRNAPEDTLIHEIQHAIQRAEGFTPGASPEYWAKQGPEETREAVRKIEGEIAALEEMLESGREEASADMIRADIDELRERLDDINRYLYQNTAGEIEARDAAARRRMTPEQRRATRPDLGDENTVFAERDDDTLEQKPKFSLEEPVEETKDLLALHNLTEQNLLDSLELGGLPMPSIAIVKAKAGHAKFGPISLVMDKAAIDPREDGRNKVYGADAWTPTVAGVEIEVNDDAERKITAKYRDLYRRFGADAARPLYNYAYDLERKLNDAGGEVAMIEELRRDTKVMNLFLADTGRDMVKDIQRETVKRMDDGQIAMCDFVLDRMGKEVFTELYNPEGRAPWVLTREWLEDHGEDFQAALADFYKSEGISEAEVEEIMQRQDYEWGGSLATASTAVKDYLKRGPETRRTEYDREATERAIQEAVDREEYDAWLRGIFSGVAGRKGIYNGKDPYTASGDRKSWGQLHYSYTLENIVRAMKEAQADRGQGSWGVTAKTLQAVSAPDFDSIEEIKAESGRLGAVDTEDYEARVADVDQEIQDVLGTIEATTKPHDSNRFTNMDYIAETLKEAAGPEASMESIMETFKREEYPITQQTARKIMEVYRAAAELPTEYFEAKPQRAVGFEEVLAAIIPDDTGAELRKALKQAGVDAVEYKAGDDEDRLEKVNSVEGAKFSVEDEEESDPEGLSLPTVDKDAPAKRKTPDELMADSRRRAEIARAERLRNIPKEDFAGTEALEKLGVRVENSVGIYQFIQSMIENDKAAKSIRKETRKAERRLYATEAERNFASGIAAGVYSQDDIPASMDTEKVMELADYYWTEQAVTTDMIQQQRSEINKTLAEKMEELFKEDDPLAVKGAKEFKPSRAIVLNNRTPERNMLHIFGDERGAAINAAIFDPVAVNEAERFRFKNRMHDAVRTFEDSEGKQSKLTKEERSIVQRAIEGRAVGEMVAGMEMSAAIQAAAENINNGMETGDAAAEFSLDAEQRKLAEKFSRWLKTKEELESGRVDQVKVENAVKKYTELFDLFYDAINDFLVAHGYEPIGFIKGYAPHIQPEENTNILNKSLQALGLNTDVTRLPSSIAGITSEYKPNKRWNPYFLSRTSDATQYDIATAFESYVEYMSDVLYHTDDIMRVRQASNYFRRTYAPEEIKENLSWAEELRYASTERKAAFLRDRGELSKSSVLTDADIGRMMDEYVDGLYADITKTTKYSDLVMYLDNYANILAGKQSMADRGWEYSGGRTVLNIGNKLVRAFGRAQVAGNLSSALNQTAQLPQIIAELGTRYTAEAIRDIWSGKLRRASWWQESDFLTGKKGVNYLVTTPGEMVISAMFKPAEIMDGFVSTVAVRGQYLKEIAKGKSHKEAMKAADAFGKGIMGSRMKGSRPLAYEAKNPVSQMLHIFQVEAVNQWEHLSQDLPRDFRRIEKERGKAAAARSLAGVIVKMLLAAFVINRIAEETYGGTPAPFDLFGLSANFIASGEGLTTNEWLRTVIDNGWEDITGERLFDTDADAGSGEFDWDAAWKDTAYNVSNDIPFLRNAAGLLGLGDETLPIPDIYGGVSDIISAVKNSGPISGETGAAVADLLFQLLPGGRQLSKAAKGAETLVRGGRYKGYGDKERLQYPVERDFWSVVRGLMFGNSGLPDTEEFYSSGMSGLSTGQTKTYQGLVEEGAAPETVYRAIQDYRAINNNKSMTAYERGVAERDMIRALDLTDDQKLELYHGMTGADSRVEKFRAMMDVGLSWDEVMDAYDKYAELDADEEAGASQKATSLARWADTQGFTDTQATTIKEQLKFFSIIPTEASRYEKFTGAGLEAEAAKDLTDAMAKLSPEDGKTSVSDMQRLRTISGSSLSEREKVAAIGTILGTELETESGGKSQYALLNDALERGYTLDEWLDMKDAGLMTESTFRKVSVGADFGVNTDLYIRCREAVEALDDNGSISQSEATEAISAMLGPSNDQKAVLWQLQNKSWKSKNNPFSPLIGEQVRTAMEDEARGLSLPALGGGAAEGSAAGGGDPPGLSLPTLGG